MLAALRAALAQARAESDPQLDDMYGQIEYHLGWRETDLTEVDPGRLHAGKLLRPSLLLYSAQLAANVGRATIPTADDVVYRALPAAVAVELVHNFSLIHDDIEDSDESRRHRPTMWKLWGEAQAINTGDALFALARAQMWGLAERGVAPAQVIRLGRLLDRACLDICEGQHLDMRFEGRREVTVAMYLQMIDRKTAALMRCSAELGGRIGAPDDEALGDRMATFGRALGLAFQLRDDLLGVWSAEDLGKTEAGDVRRKKMSLPIIHAIEHANATDRRTLAEIYSAPGSATKPQIARVLAALEHTGARQHVRDALREQITHAHDALAAVVGANAATGATGSDAYTALAGLLAYVGAEAA
jgi:geranylgeranyl diphosphate synthase type I